MGMGWVRLWVGEGEREGRGDGWWLARLMGCLWRSARDGMGCWVVYDCEKLDT